MKVVSLASQLFTDREHVGAGACCFLRGMESDPGWLMNGTFPKLGYVLSTWQS